MIEFGSDFHRIEDFVSLSTQFDGDRNFLLPANGRQAIELLIKENQWNRIWMPEYFCYEVVNSVQKTGIEAKFYNDFPGNDDEGIISCLSLREDYFEVET